MRRSWSAVLLVLAVLAGCTGEPQVAPTPPVGSEAEPTTTAEAEPSPRPSRSASPRPSPSPQRVLDDRYYQDSDGNAIPDFVEIELGYDPNVEDCLVRACPDAETLLSPQGEPVQFNTLLILDSSGSMAADDGTGTIKIDAARQALERYAIATPDTTRLGLMVYGHRGNNTDAGRAASCAGIDTLAPLGELTADTAAATLAQFQPTGWTPVAGSLQRAAQEFTGAEGDNNRVILVTDGIETCDGDPVAAARTLADSGVAITVDVVGFDIEDADQAALRAIAEATGGTYTDAQTAADLNAYIDSERQNYREAVTALTCLSRTVLNAGGCRGRLATEASDLLAAERDVNAEVGSPEYEAYDALLYEVGTTLTVINDAEYADTQPKLEELQSAAESAYERYAARYGEDVSLLPPCWTIVT